MPETIAQLVDQARSLLKSPAAWAAAAPGRVNLIGEHVDYNDGLVLPIAIDRWCVAVAHRSVDSLWRVASRSGDTASFSDPLHPIAPDFGTLRGYARGVVASLRASGMRCPPLTIGLASSVPIGAGLSSSASLEVCLAKVILNASGTSLGLGETARACRAAERDYAGVNCGVMDQTISLAGLEGHAIMLDCRSGAMTPIALPPPALARILVIDTKAKHQLTESPYAQRRQWCESAALALDVPSLRVLADAPDALAALERRRTALLPDEYRAARHVVTEIHRVRGAADALTSHDFTRLGELMNQSHASLRHEYRVSCDELDVAADTARNTPGVFGARMTGGGFGGCVLALCAPDRVSHVSAAVSSAFFSRFSSTPDSFHIDAVGGACDIALAAR